MCSPAPGAYYQSLVPGFAISAVEAVISGYVGVAVDDGRASMLVEHSFQGWCVDLHFVCRFCQGVLGTGIA